MLNPEFFGLLQVEVSGQNGYWLNTSIPSHLHIAGGITD
jgi:hypothetical protein